MVLLSSRNKRTKKVISITDFVGMSKQSLGSFQKQEKARCPGSDFVGMFLQSLGNF